MNKKNEKEILMYWTDMFISLLIMSVSLYLSFYVVLPHTHSVFSALLSFIVLVVMLMFIKDCKLKDAINWMSGGV